jgi:PilZ domain
MEILTIESSPDNQNRRKRERLVISLPIRVECQVSKNESWDEISRLIDVTPFGAGFLVSHLIEVGQLLQLTLPLPRQLRCFDHLETQYCVWALVRHVRRMAHDADEKTRYLVGVAFIGKHPPPDYEENPTKRYEILKQDETGMWLLQELTEPPPKKSKKKLSIEDTRRATRHKIPLDVILEVFNENGEIISSETTVTENISLIGASVFTSMDVERGRFVRLTSENYNVSLVAVVKMRRATKNGFTRLHLEFIDRRFPLEGIE